MPSGTTHKPLDEVHWVSCLRENLTSSSYGEGLETEHARRSYRASPLPDSGARYESAAIRNVHPQLMIL
jgi:hypothetical protein